MFHLGGTVSFTVVERNRQPTPSHVQWVNEYDSEESNESYPWSLPKKNNSSSTIHVIDENIFTNTFCMNASWAIKNRVAVSDFFYNLFVSFEA